MAFCVEGFNYLRFNIQAKILRNYNPLISYEEDSMSIPIKKRLQLILLYFGGATLSYLLLLLIFQLDIGIFLVATGGYTAGYAVFGFKRRKSYYFLYNPKPDKC